jgi:hypothetical protein
MDLDAVDQAILRLLQEDARLSFRELARRTGVSTPTAAAKVRRLEAMGVIQGYRAVLAGQEDDAPKPPTAVAIPCHECDGPIHGAGVHKQWDADGRRDHWFCCRICAGEFEARLLARAKGASKARR